MTALDLVVAGAVPLVGTGAGNGDCFGKVCFDERGSVRPADGRTAVLLAGLGAVIGTAVDLVERPDDLATALAFGFEVFTNTLAGDFEVCLMVDFAPGVLAVATLILGFLLGGDLVRFATAGGLDFADVVDFADRVLLCDAFEGGALRFELSVDFKIWPLPAALVPWPRR